MQITGSVSCLQEVKPLFWQEGGVVHEVNPQQEGRVVHPRQKGRVVYPQQEDRVVHQLGRVVHEVNL